MTFSPFHWWSKATAFSLLAALPSFAATIPTQASRASSKIGSRQPAGASLQITRIDQSQNRVSILVTNTSRKDITAFTFSYLLRYFDGTTDKGEHLVDFLPAMTSGEALLGNIVPGEGALHPGQSQEAIVGFTPSSVNPLVQIIPSMEVIVYGDRTSEVHDPDSFQRVLDVRGRSLLTKRKATAILKQSLVDPANPHPIPDAIAALTKWLETAKANPSGEFTSDIDIMIKDLQKMAQQSFEQNSTGTQKFRAYIERVERESQMLTPHTEQIEKQK